MAIAPASLRVRRGRRVGNLNALIGQPALAGSVLAGQPLGVGRLRPPRTGEPLSLRGIGPYFARPPRGGQPAWDRMRPAAIVRNYGPAGATRPNSGGSGAGSCMAAARSWSRSGTPCRLFGGSDDGRRCGGAMQESASQRRQDEGPEHRALDVSEAPILRADQAPRASSSCQPAPSRRCAVPSTGDCTWLGPGRVLIAALSILTAIV